MVSWVQCDCCGIVLSDKDVQIHESDCPPNKTNLTCPYVLNDSLHCLLDVLSKDGKNLLIY